MDNLEERQRIGDTIRTARKENKVTQTQLGIEIGVGKVAIANYESGKIKVIPFEKRVKLARLLDIPVAALLYADEAPATLRGADDIISEVYAGFVRSNPRQNALISSACAAVRNKEVTIYVEYFKKQSSEWNLGQLIYAVIKSFAILRAPLCFYDVLERLLAYRFCLAGMGEEVANQYAQQLQQPLVLVYHMYAFAFDDERIHLEDWFASSNVSDKAFQAALSDTLQYFQQIKNDSVQPATSIAEMIKKNVKGE